MPLKKSYSVCRWFLPGSGRAGAAARAAQTEAEPVKKPVENEPAEAPADPEELEQAPAEAEAPAVILPGQTPEDAGDEAAVPEDFMLDGWYCEKCGSFNRGRICKECGAVKPADAVQYVCDNCGWTAPDPQHPPRFCPDCGHPFAAADQQ